MPILSYAFGLHKKRPATDLSQDYFLERVKGVEPSSQAWEARILPMNYTCEYVYYSIY